MKIATPRLSPKTKAALAVALALLLWIPQGISEDTQPVVTGHSTFYNGERYDPCMASVAGIVRSRVMWFNDQVLMERYPGKGTYVYITEHGGMDPSSAGVLYSQGVTYNFVDPNGAAWSVQELYMDPANYSASPTANVGTGNPTQATQPPVAKVDSHRQYVWVVELAATPVYDQFPGGDSHTYYNFLDMVDTCKFNNNTATYAATITHTGDEPVHVADGPRDHTHEVWNADIYLGTAPNVVLAGEANNPVPGYTTSWATDGNAADAGSGSGATSR